MQHTSFFHIKYIQTSVARFSKHGLNEMPLSKMLQIGGLRINRIINTEYVFYKTL